MAKEIPKFVQYWADRTVLLNESMLDAGDAYYEKLSVEYERAMARIEKEINAFYTRFAKDNKISYADAKRILTTNEKRIYQMELQDYIDKMHTLEHSGEWMQAIENASTAHRVTRLQSLQVQMRMQVEDLFAKYDTGLKNTTTKILKESYYQHIFEQQQQDGYVSAFAKLDTDKVKTIINSPWAPDGTDFSEKIWKDRTGLVEYLNKEMTQAFIRGESADRLIKEIKKKFGVSSKNAARLVQTESAFFSGKAKIESFKALGYKKYIIIAVMDAKTSEICRDMDGEVFNIDDFKPGITASPFHPRCRTTIAPYEATGQGKIGAGRVRNPITGKVELIPQHMTFHEWYAQFVADNDENDSE